MNAEEAKTLPYSDQEYRRQEKDNPVIPPRFAAILRKHPFPTVKNAYSHKKTKLCLWYGYRSDGHFIIEMMRRVLLMRTFVHGVEITGISCGFFVYPLY